MKIGVIGVGVVGTAIKRGFEDLGHEVKIHDIKFNTSIRDVINTDILYLCLPTNSNEDGSCDIEQILKTLKALSNYKGIIAVKSTIIPGTYNKLKKLRPILDKCGYRLVKHWLGYKIRGGGCLHRRVLIDLFLIFDSTLLDLRGVHHRFLFLELYLLF